MLFLARIRNSREYFFKKAASIVEISESVIQSEAAAD